jgi:hypothetical protein
MSKLPSARRRGDATASPAVIRDILGKPQFLSGEDPEDYERLYDQVTVGIDPRDSIEAIWIHEVVDLLWEARRLRRLRDKWLKRIEFNQVAVAIKQFDLDEDEEGALLDGWVRGDIEAVELIKRRLPEVAMDPERVLLSRMLTIDKWEKLDQMIHRSEIRLDQVIREIQRRREVLAKQLETAIGDLRAIEGDSDLPDNATAA